MHAIHLNYHEITSDPRVLKECESLARRGVKVSVVCALATDSKPFEKVGDLTVHRIDWLRTADVSRRYVKELRHFHRSAPFIRKKFFRILAQNDISKYFPRTGPKPASKPNAVAVAPVGVQPSETTPRARSSFFRVTARALRLRSLAKAFRLRSVARALGLGKIARSLRVFQPHRRLYQASAFLFDVNLRKLNFDEQVDVVHAHDIYTLPAGVALARKHGARLIYDAHEFEIARASKMPPEGNGMVDAIERDCLAHVDALITVSNGLKKLYAERYSSSEPIVIFNAPVIGVSDYPAPAPQERADFRAKIGVDSTTPLLAYTGLVLKEQRGLDQVLEALEFLPEYHLIVLGPRHHKNDARLMESAKNIGVETRVHLLEPVHHSRVAPTIRSCDVAIVPFQDATLSYRYAMPNKLFEALFSGLPVCVSNLPDMREAVETLGRGRAMDQTNPKDIAATIAYLFENRASYTMTREAWADLVREFSWSAQEDKLYRLYQKLVPPAHATTNNSGQEAISRGALV